MLQIMNEITDKPNWHVKVGLIFGSSFLVHTDFKQVYDEEITMKWRQEALGTDDRDITEKMIDWCIAELRHKAKLFEQTGFVSVYDADIVKSDTAIPFPLKQRLQNAVKILEEIPDNLKDWHPRSDDKVLDLVHPSLFPLIYGRSRVLEDGVVDLEDCSKQIGQGITIPEPQKEQDDPAYSRRFQWLPCDVELHANGSDVRCVI
jgi:hypothetical protein